jgi:hypothetical protein
VSDLTHDVKIRGVEHRQGVKGKMVSYRLIWRVAGRIWRKTFDSRAQADAHRSALVSASRSGEAFLVDSGIPLSWAPQRDQTTWYEFTLAYTDAKRPHLSPNSRRGLAEALADATDVLLTRRNGPALEDLRAASDGPTAYGSGTRPSHPPSSRPP